MNIGNIYKHIKTGGFYRIIYNDSTLQIDGEFDMTKCIIYQSIKDNRIWVRPIKDFEERFEIIEK